MPKARAVSSPLQSEIAQGYVRGCRCLQCNSGCAVFTSFPIFTHIPGQGHPVLASNDGGCIPSQLQSPSAVHFSKTPVLNASESSFHDLLGYTVPQDALPAGPLSMFGAGHLSMSDLPSPAETYNPLSMTTPCLRVPQAPNARQPIGPEEFQMYSRDLSSSTWVTPPRGPDLPLCAGHPSRSDPGFLVEAYNSSSMIVPDLCVPQASDPSPPIDPEGLLSYLGDFSLSTFIQVAPLPDSNLAVDPQLFEANLYPPTGEISPLVNVIDPSTPTELSAPRDHSVRKQCGWRDAHGSICGIEITYRCQSHFATAHGIINLSTKTNVWCRWCDSKVRRGCFLRHVREVHLRVPRST